MPVISLESIIRSSSIPMIRSMPRRVVAMISRLLYEREFNAALDRCRDRYGFQWVNEMLASFHIAVEAANPENARDCGRAVFTPNHTVGGLDGMAVLSVIGRYHTAAKSLSSDFLMAIPNVASFIIPVGTTGSQSRTFFKAVDELYASDAQVLCFAAGRVSGLHNGRIADQPWSKSFIVKAIQHKRNVVPVFIGTTNRQSYYRYQKIRSLIKRITGVSLERFFILRAQYHQRGNTFRLNFGDPIPYSAFDHRHTAEEWAQLVRRHVYLMGLHGNPPFDPTLPAQGQ